MAKQKWRPIPGCSNYAIGSHGQVKRKRHKSTGKYYSYLPEMIVEPQMNRNGVVYANIRTDDGTKRTIGIQKLVLQTYGQSGVTYYKISDDPFNNRIDVFVPSFIYDRLSDSPTIHKTVKI